MANLVHYSSQVIFHPLYCGNHFTIYYWPPGHFSGCCCVPNITTDDKSQRKGSFLLQLPEHPLLQGLDIGNGSESSEETKCTYKYSLTGSKSAPSKCYIKHSAALHCSHEDTSSIRVALVLNLLQSAMLWNWSEIKYDF